MRVFFFVPEQLERTYHTHTILGGTLLKGAAQTATAAPLVRLEQGRCRKVE